MVDYSKLSTADLIKLKQGNYSGISTEGLLILKGKTPNQPVRPRVQKGSNVPLNSMGLPDYSDIMNNKNLTREQKVKAIQDRGNAYRAQETKDTQRYINKQRLGAALQIGSAAIPVGVGGQLVARAPQIIRPLAQMAPGLLASGATYGVGNTMMNKDNATAKDYIKGAAGGAVANYAGGKALQGIAKGGQAVLNSKAVTKVLPKVQELTTSVPAEYSERAIQKELAGDSIFKGKFNAKDLNENYYNAGQKAINGIKDLELEANQAINKATKNLNELPQIDREQLANQVIDDIDEYRNGGTRNPAIDEKGTDIEKYLNEILNDTSNSDLAATKGKIQNILRSKYGQETGAGVNALKGIGHTIRDTLNTASPEYALANANRENLFRVKNDLNGMNAKTMASRLRNVEGDASVRSGYNQAAEELNNLVKPEYKFLDDVTDLRAREALEQWYPGQYGGSGTSQGFGNLLRAGLLSGTIGGLSHNPIGAAVGAAMVSPKIFGKGTIQNIGRLNRAAQKASDIYDYVYPQYNAGSTLTRKLLKK